MTSSRKVLLVVHTGRDQASKIAADFARQLSAAGIGVRALGEAADALRRCGAGKVELVDSSLPGVADGCELAVVFGGDGTILRGAELVRDSSTALLGVNLGHVGFLAEAEVDDLAATVRRVVDQDYDIEERMTLDVTAEVGGEEVCRSWALNEATVEKASRERMLEVVVAIDDRPLSRWGCDGVVCATPTGSTAYNFSAGGPIVWPDVEALLMVPISAHALFARPMVVSPSSVFLIDVVAGSAGAGVLWCDGRRTHELPPGARVRVTRGSVPVRLARLHRAPFTDRLVRKFDLPVAGWRGLAEQRPGRAGDPGGR